MKKIQIINIYGVGSKFKKLLIKAGYDTVEMIATTEPQIISNKTNIPYCNCYTIVENAKRLLHINNIENNPNFKPNIRPNEKPLDYISRLAWGELIRDGYVREENGQYIWKEKGLIECYKLQLMWMTAIKLKNNKIKNNLNL